MGRFKEQNIIHLNYITQNYGQLISKLAENAAKDEAFSKEIFDNEEELKYIDDGIEYYTNSFQVIFDTHYDYFFELFLNNIELPSKNEYVLIEWPDWQDLSDNDWFENEAILNISESSYFIPKYRLI